MNFLSGHQGQFSYFYFLYYLLSETDFADSWVKLGMMRSSQSLGNHTRRNRAGEGTRFLLPGHAGWGGPGAPRLRVKLTIWEKSECSGGAGEEGA